MVSPHLECQGVDLPAINLAPGQPVAGDGATVAVVEPPRQQDRADLLAQRRRQRGQFLDAYDHRSGRCRGAFIVAEFGRARLASARPLSRRRAAAVKVAAVRPLVAKP